MKKIERPHTKNPLAPGLPDWCKAIVALLSTGRALTREDFRLLQSKWKINRAKANDFIKAYAQALCVAAMEIERRKLVEELSSRESSMVEVIDHDET